MQPTKMEHYYVRATVFILVFILVRVSALKTTNLNSNATFQSVVSTAGKPLHWFKLDRECIEVNGMIL